MTEKSNIPREGTSQWKKNEKIINENPVLKSARDIQQGFRPKPGQTHGGKGSARRGSDNQLYADNWEKIFGNKNKDD